MTTKVTKKSTKTEVLYLCFCKFANYYAYVISIMIKKVYIRPRCQTLDAQPLNYVLMGSNEGYEVDPFNPFND